MDSLEPGPNGGFLLRTSAGELPAAVVVVCTGAYQQPHRPAIAAGFPRDVLAIDAQNYRNPAALPPGKVLVVGSGQTGCQLSEELHESGREVFLACGRAPWLPRRPGGRDIVTWLKQTSFFDTPLSALPSPAARLGANLLVTGHRGGHDLHYRTLQAMGVQLLGRLAGVAGHRASFAGDLADSVAFGDARYADIRKLLTEQLPTKGIRAPELPDPPPFHADPPLELDLTGFGVVIFTSGFRPDYATWVRFPAFDAIGFPLTDNGASTVVPGLFFCGVHFLRKRKSSVLFGVGEDAATMAQSIARNQSPHRTTPPSAELAGSVQDASAADPPYLPGDPGDPCRPLRRRLRARIGLVAARPGQEPRPPLASRPRRSGVRASAREEPAPLDLPPDRKCDRPDGSHPAMQSVNRSRHDVVVVGGRVAGQASVRYGWPLHVIENAGHLVVAERPEEFLEALRAALGNH